MKKDSVPFQKDEKVGEFLRDVHKALVLNARIPVSLWPEGGVFKGIKNAAWHALTNEMFPARNADPQGTHRGYVRKKNGNLSLRLQGLSSKNYDGPGQANIPDMTEFALTGYRNDGTSYLVERAIVNLGLGRKFTDAPRFLGIWAEKVAEENGTSDN